MADGQQASVGPVKIETLPPEIPAEGSELLSRSGGIKVRLTLGPALIDLEATLEEIVVVVTKLTTEFNKAGIISQA